ncbi:MAG: YqjF family protein [Gemmatimonadales bacterium]
MSPGRPFLTASWRYLAMLNYEVPAALLQPMVPAGTELDSFRGAVLATVVGFRFLDTRVLGVAVPGHRDFDEVNLRFYVRRRAEDGWRRAVVFVRELVPRRAIALIARWTYNEPYTAAPMRHDLDVAGAAVGLPGRVAYEWRLAGRWHRLEVRTTGRASRPDPDSEPAFIAERDWGYTVQRDAGTREYRVTHPAWRMWTEAAGQLDCEVGAVYGKGFAECLTALPRSVFLVEGSEVQVYRGRRLTSAVGRFA